jgi:iron(III) transport system ATP-binding protein
VSSIQVSQLSLSFGRRQVLANLDLHVPAGAVTAVLGSSGCGKTTLLRALAGLIRPSAGRIRIGDDVVVGPGVWVRPERRNVGVVPQEGALFPHLDVAGNVGFGLRGRGRDRRVAELLALVGMAGTASLRPHQLSGGMQQRVAVARALSRRPRVVLLDEPFSALDTGLREAVRTDVFSAIAEDGATAVLVTHDQDEALGVADRVAVMRDGRIVQEGTPAQVYSEPSDAAVAAFLGEATELRATVRSGPDSAVECALGTVKVRLGCADAPATGVPGILVIRPEDVTLDPVLENVSQNGSPTGPRAGAVAPVATVTSIRYHGHDCLVRAVLDDGTGITARSLGLPPLRTGDRARVGLSAPPLFFAAG